MANEFKIVVSAVSKGFGTLNRSLQGIPEHLNKARLAGTAFNETMKHGRATVSSLTGHLKTLLGAYVGFQSVSRTTEIIKQADQAMFNMRSSVRAATREFDDTGTMDQWTASVRELSGELVIYSDTALMNAVSRTVDMTKRLGLTDDQMKEVIKRSADLGAGKVELEGAIERVTAALRGEAESAEYLGLTLNETYIRSWYEASDAHSKAWKDLTDVEKAQIRYQVLLEQSSQFQGRAAESAMTFGGALQLVRKEIENAVINNTDITEALTELASVLREHSGEIGAFVSTIVSGIAHIIRFAVEYRKLLLIIAGTAVAVAAVGKLVTIIKALNAAVLVLTGTNIVGWLSAIKATNIIAWFASLRAAIATVAASAGVAGIALKAGVAGAAAWGVYQIAKLIKTIYEWRQAAREAKESMDRLNESSDAYMDKYQEFSNATIPENITGKAPEELEELRRQMSGALAYYTALSTKLWAKTQETTIFGNPTKEAKAARKELEAVNETLQNYKNAVWAIHKERSRNGSVISLKTKVKPLSPEEIKSIKADQEKLERQLSEALLKHSGDRFAVRHAQAKQQYDKQVALAHGKNDLLLKAQKLYHSEVSKIESERQALHHSRETSRLKSQISRMKTLSQSSLTLLEQTYADGEIALDDYFARRRELIEAQYRAEINALNRQAELENDTDRKRSINDQIFKREHEHRQALIRLTRDQKAAEQQLADARKEADTLLSDMRTRGDHSMTAEYQRELAELDERHRGEIDRLESLNAKKEQLDEAYRLQKAEKDTLLLDQEKRTHQLRIEAVSQVAGSISELFENLYEMTGKKSKEFFYIQKAAAIAEAVINTYLGATKAFTSLSGIPVVGPALGMTAAAAAVSAGMMKVAMIQAQQLASGGPVLGFSPSDTADNVPVMATAGEFMQPVSAVKHYGMSVMEGIRKRLIPKEVFSGFSAPLSHTASFALASGGSVGPSRNQTKQDTGVSITNVNVLDPNLLDRYVTSSKGKTTIINLIAENAYQINRLLNR